MIQTCTYLYWSNSIMWRTPSRRLSWIHRQELCVRIQLSRLGKDYSYLETYTWKLSPVGVRHIICFVRSTSLCLESLLRWTPEDLFVTSINNKNSVDYFGIDRKESFQSNWSDTLYYWEYISPTEQACPALIQTEYVGYLISFMSFTYSRLLAI